MEEDEVLFGLLFICSQVESVPSLLPWPPGRTSSTCQTLALTHAYPVSTLRGDAGGGIALAHARVALLLLFPLSNTAPVIS